MLIPTRAYFFCTPALGLRAELEKKAVNDHTSVKVVPTPIARLSCPHVDSRLPVLPNFFV